MAKKITNKLVHLPQDITIDRYEEHPDSLELFISYPPEERICPECRSHECVIHSSGHSETIRHLSIGGKGVLLTFHVPRLRCKSCGRTFHQHPYFVQPGFKLSQLAYVTICEELTTNRSIRQIAIDTGATESIVYHVMMAADFDSNRFLPETLCIDEFKGSSGRWDPDRSRWDINRFHCNIADGDFGCVVDILPQIDKPFLTEYFHGYSIEKRRKVRFFCCDMHGGFISLAQTCFPSATICVDNFHTVRLLKDNMDELRRSLQRHYSSMIVQCTDPIRKQSYQESYLLLKRSLRLLAISATGSIPSASREERTNRVLALSEDLDEAYMAYQELLCILHLDVYTLQRAELTEWISKYSSSLYEGTRRCANTIRHYRSYIQNAWKYGKSNASCEGLNNKIKVLKRNGYGAHSFKCFRQRILFHCGAMQFVRKAFTISSQKNKKNSKQEEN